MQPLRLGLIGAGRWGRNYIRTIGELDGVRLAAVASNNPRTKDHVPADCRVSPDWREVVHDDVDGIIIASPPMSHFEILKAAAEAGRAVLVEKPLVRSRSDLERLKVLLANTQATIVVDHTHLFHPAFEKLLSLAPAHGPIRSIRSSAGNLGPYRVDTPVLWDWGPHDIAMCLALVPGSCSGRASVVERRQVSEGTGETIALELILAGGIPARVTLSTLAARHRYFAVDFADCTLLYRDEHPSLFRLERGASPGAAGEVIPCSAERPLARAVNAFADAILTADRSRASVGLGIAVVEVLLQLDAS
jgi:predicted dehydrogenase